MHHEAKAMSITSELTLGAASSVANVADITSYSKDPIFDMIWERFVWSWISQEAQIEDGTAVRLRVMDQWYDQHCQARARQSLNHWHSFSRSRACPSPYSLLLPPARHVAGRPLCAAHLLYLAAHHGTVELAPPAPLLPIGRNWKDSAMRW